MRRLGIFALHHQPKIRLCLIVTSPNIRDTLMDNFILSAGHLFQLLKAWRSCIRHSVPSVEGQVTTALRATLTLSLQSTTGEEAALKDTSIA